MFETVTYAGAGPGVVEGPVLEEGVKVQVLEVALEKVEEEVEEEVEEHSEAAVGAGEALPYLDKPGSRWQIRFFEKKYFQ